MPLNLKDLLEEKSRLEQIIQHAQTELNALTTLIEGRQLRGEQNQIGAGRFATDVDKTLQNKSIVAAVETVIRELPNERYTAPSLAQKLRDRGYQTGNKNLQSNVSSALKKLWEDKILDRRNIGGRRPLYSYRLRQESLFEKENE